MREYLNGPGAIPAFTNLWSSLCAEPGSFTEEHLFQIPMDLPTLDFSRFLNGSEEARLELAYELVKSFETHGFVKLTNHGIPEAVVEDYLRGV